MSGRSGQAASGYALRSLPADDEFTRAANSKGVSTTAASYSYPQLGFKKPALAPGQF